MVGIVIGVIGAVVIAGALVFCALLSRRKKAAAEQQDYRSQRGSSAGMMGTPRTEMGEAGSSTWGSGDGGTLGRRQSKLMPVDPRMDPFNPGLYVRNKSQESITTLRDDRDYSRKVHQPKVLRAMNPDPHHEDD